MLLNEKFTLLGKVSKHEWLAKYCTKYGTVYYIVHDDIKTLSSVDNCVMASLLRESQMVPNEETSELVENILDQIPKLDL